MKLRLQLAGMLPATAKLGPTDLLGKGAFGTTMQEMMAMLPSGKISPVGNFQASAGMQSQIAKNPGTGKPGEASEGSAAEDGEVFVAPEGIQVGTLVPGLPHDPVAHLSEQLEGQCMQRPKSSPLSPEAPAKEVLQGSMPEGPLVQNPIGSQLPHMISEQGEQQPQQPLPVATSQLVASSKDRSSPTRHKAEKAEGEGHVPAANGPSSDVPLVAQSVPILVPILVPQPGGLKLAPLTSSLEVERGQVRAQDASRRGPVQPAIASHGESPSDPLTISGSPSMTQSRIMVAVTSDKLPEPILSDTNIQRSTNAHPVAVITGKETAGAVAPADRDRHLQAAASAGFVTNAKQINTSVPKENERKIGTEQEFQVTVNLPGHSTPMPATTQHQGVPNVPQAVFHGPQKMMDVHRPQATAAQVLQRMDMAAAPGAVQLRADARRLDVGVSSAALGWVEVRATAAASGRVDATLQVQSDSSAHVLASQSREISEYAREHSAPLGELSVGVGTGHSARDESRPAHGDGRRESGTQGRETTRPPANDEDASRPADTMSFISIRA